MRARPAEMLLAGAILMLLPAAGLGWFRQSFDLVRDLPPWRRAACLGFAAVSLPFQFMPFAVAASRKFAERREVDRARLRLAPGPAAVTAGARA